MNIESLTNKYAGSRATASARGLAGAFLLIAAGVFSLQDAVAGEPNLLPVPDAAAQAESMKAVKEVYGDEWAAAKTDAARQALAKKLLAKGRENDKDPAARFVLLRLAKNIAVQAHDGGTALESIDEIGKSFQVDAGQMKTALLTALAAGARGPEDHKSVAEHSLAMMDEATAADDFAAARQRKELAVGEARKARDASLLRRALERAAEAGKLEQAYEAVKTAVDTLKKSPDDPGANAIGGKYYCFGKGDYQKGVPMLAKCNDAKLKALAQSDVRGATAAEEQVKLGDAWWDAGARTRAAYWYQKALPELAGLQKDKAQVRLGEASRASEKVAKRPSPQRPVDRKSAQLTLMLNDMTQWSIKNGRWETRDKKIIGSGDSAATFSGDLPADFVLSFKMNVTKGMRPRIRFRDFYVGNEGYNKTIAVHGGRETKCRPFEYKNNQELAIRVACQGEEVSLAVNEQPVGTTRREEPQPETLQISGGDDWSAGAVEYSDFRVSLPENKVVEQPTDTEPARLRPAEGSSAPVPFTPALLKRKLHAKKLCTP